MMKEIKPYMYAASEVLKAMDSGEEGLTDNEVKDRQLKFGRNELTEYGRISRWRILFSQFKSPIVFLLLVAAAVSYFFGELSETLAILLVIVVNGVIGYILESQAMHSMRALKKLDKAFCQVKRGGQLHKIDAVDLVPGDIVNLEAGDLIPADGRLIASRRCQVNEASLTGESVPVEKDEQLVLPETTVLADRRNQVFKGTSITKGNAIMVVTETGISTECFW
jgi:Ca2+-transporting ATPase